MDACGDPVALQPLLIFQTVDGQEGSLSPSVGEKEQNLREWKHHGKWLPIC
jgi:hypothetical protein